VFAPISVLLAAFFLVPALPNGIQLAEIPSTGESVEIVAGYAAGGLTGLPSLPAVRSLTLMAYAAGGDLKFFNERDRTGVRIAVPRWALEMFTEQLASLLKDVPSAEKEVPVRTDQDFRAKVEAEIHDALLGPASATTDYATDRAFVLFPGPIPDALRNSLAAIPSRPSNVSSEIAVNRLPAERTLRFKSDLETGAVIFAAPAPTVYYQEWYSILLLDRVIRRVVPVKVATELQLTMHPYYYRIEVPVPPGQFPEPVEESLLQELQRLEFTRAEAKALEAARQDAREYLESRGAVEWFSSVGIPERRVEGIQWIQAMTADDVRVAARDLLLANRVVATWAPRPKQARVEVEDLGRGDAGVRPSPGALSRNGGGLSPVGEAGSIALPGFPPHSDVSPLVALPEKLASGVSIVASNINAVFVSGGTLTKYEREPDAETLKNLQMYRADRILVLTPPQSMDRARQFWSSFKGNSSGSTGVAKGNVSSGDLPALVLLKVLLDRKLIEAGSWTDAELRIDATAGSTLTISADTERRAGIIEWIKRWAAEKPTDSDLAWAREVAIHRFGTMQADLQALTWERDPQGTIQDLQTVSSGHVQDVARIYF
jgi:hypothetical protein